MDKIDAAIARLRTGSLMAERYTGKPMVITYSGGKDSDVLLHLARRADIPIEVSHGLTTVDAPETVRHVKKVFRELELDGISAHIEFGKYKGKRVTMWKLIVQKGIPPTRLMRYCCSVFKESSGNGRMIATGVRWQESSARAKRAAYEALAPRKEDKILVNDNDESRRLYEDCRLKGTRVTNPLIDWTDAEVWQYIHDNHICTNPLYGMGYTRVGCVGCPMAGYVARVNEFVRWPKYRQAYLHAFERMLDVRRSKGLKSDLWHNAEDVMRWWLEDQNAEGQMTMEELIAEGSGEA